LAILAYHHVGSPSADGWETWFYIPEDTFVAQLEWLRSSSWQITDLGTVLKGLRNPAILALRSVLITFDDAYRSIVECALPHLQRYSYPAVVFVPTDFIGGTNTFEPQGWAPVEQICTWEDLRLLESEGLSIQSHGKSHRRLSELTEEDRRVELRRSKLRLEEGMGWRVEAFAFPYGDQGKDSRRTSGELCDAGYQLACTYGTPQQVNRLPTADPFSARRVAMGPDTDLEMVLGAD
jgi:peptidoglycan/xylan/chitin deacetylase (PgdA/CDA1 family)